MRADLRRRSVRGGVLAVASQGGQFIVQTISTLLLARLLTPFDFGLVAMVTAVTGVAYMFADVGLSEATIQREDITQDQVSSLFWINVAVGLLLMFVTAAAGPLLSWFYTEPRLTGITVSTSISFLISGLRVQHDALIKRQMRFEALAIRDIASQFVGVSVGVTAALHGTGYWALVVSPLAVNATQMALSWLMVRWRPNPPRRVKEVRSMLIFGGNLSLSYFIGHLNRNADNLLIGRFWGAQFLGLYSRAYNLLMLPMRQISGPFSAVALPAFSRIQDDQERYARFYLRSVNVIMWIIAPLTGFLFVASEPLIVLTLGNQWHESVPVFRMLAISAFAQPLFDTTGWLFVAQGRTDRLLKLGLVTSPFIVGSFVVGLPFGIRGVALSYSVVLLAILPWVFKFTFRDTNLTLYRLGYALRCPVVIGLTAVVIAAGALHLISLEGIFVQLSFVAMVFAAVYALSILTMRPVRSEICAIWYLWRDIKSSDKRVVLIS